MILPDKHLTIANSLIGAGAMLLEHLDSPRSVSELWDRVRRDQPLLTFHRFGLILTYLYTIGTVGFESDLIARNVK